MADRGDAEILQVVNRQFRQHRTVDFVVRNAPSYCPRPRLRSQSPTSMVAPAYGLTLTMAPERPRVPGKSAGRPVWGSSLACGHAIWDRPLFAWSRPPRRQAVVASRFP